MILELTLGQAIGAFIAAMGIPGALTGFLIWRLQRKMEERERLAKEQEQAREDLELLNIKATLAAVTLAEATANAVARIPDTNCNGDMHSALEYATKVKHEVRDFLTTQATRAVVK